MNWQGTDHCWHLAHAGTPTGPKSLYGMNNVRRHLGIDGVFVEKKISASLIILLPLSNVFMDSVAVSLPNSSCGPKPPHIPEMTRWKETTTTAGDAASWGGNQMRLTVVAVFYSTTRTVCVPHLASLHSFVTLGVSRLRKPQTERCFCYVELLL